MILLIDNYDSFTYNLYQQVSRLGGQVQVIKNDQLTLAEIRTLKPDKIILSPGPRTPADAGICVDVIREFADRLAILGVCLGHQCLGVAFGRRVMPARQLLYGKTSLLQRGDSRLLQGLPASFPAARYHSLVLDGVPEGFLVTARDASGDIMAMEDRVRPLFGVQFHPESFLMDGLGDPIIQNFLAI